MIRILFLDYELSNKKLKNQIVERFGDEVCFSYPRDKRKSALFFANSIETSEIVNTLHSQDFIKLCAQTLKSECQDYSFEIDGSNKSACNLAAGLDKFKAARLCAWDSFFKEMFPFRVQSEQIQRKCESIYFLHPRPQLNQSITAEYLDSTSCTRHYTIEEID